MAEQLYSIIQRKDTEEYHIFKSYFDPETDKCTLSEHDSICKKMEYQKGDIVFALCKNEQNTRLKAAEKGRPVCGICVSTLYTTDYK